MQPAIPPDTHALTQQHSRFRHPWLLVVPLLLLAAWLGARGLDADSLWYDEWLAVFRAGSDQYGGPLSLAEVWERTTSVGRYQNPAYYMVLSVWGRQAGFSEFGGRSLSLLAGLLAVAWTYRLGRDIGGTRTGWVAASVLASSAFFVDYLHEMRAYALYMMFTAMVIWAYWRLALAGNRQQGRREWGIRLLFVLSTIGMLYSHYFGLLTVAALGLYHLLFVPKNRRWWIVVGLLVVAGIGYTPWLTQSLDAVNETSVDQGRKAGAMSVQTTIEMLAKAFSNNSVAFAGFISAVALVTVRWRGPAAQRRRDLLPWVLVVVIFVAGLVVNERLGVLAHIRYLFALWIPLALLVGTGIDRLAQRSVPPALVAGIWIVAGLVATFDASFMPSIHGTFKHLPFRELANVVEEHGQPDDAVVLHVPDFNWLREPTFKHYLAGKPGRHTLMESLPGLPGDEYNAYAREFIDDAPRAWLAVDKTLPPTFRLDAFITVLAENYAHCQSVFDLPTMRLDLYARTPTEPALYFGDGIGVTLLEPLPDSVSGDTLTPLLGWTVSANVPQNVYSVGLHVLTADGVSVAQVDSGLPVDAFSCSRSTLALDELAPGEYTLVALVYDWQTGERLTGENTASGQQADMLPLGSFAVR